MSYNALFAAASSASASLASIAAAFTAAALASAQDSTPDPSLEQQLGTVEAARDRFLSAITATLAQTLEPDVSLTPYRDAAHQTYAGCVFLLESVKSQKPVLVPHTVPKAMPLDQILVALYGSDASNHFEEVLSLNRIQTPLWVPMGTVLQVVAPQVLQ